MMDLHHTITSIRAARESEIAMPTVTTPQIEPRSKPRMARFAKGVTARLTALLDEVTSSTLRIATHCDSGTSAAVPPTGDSPPISSPPDEIIW